MLTITVSLPVLIGSFLLGSLYYLPFSFPIITQYIRETLAGEGDWLKPLLGRWIFPATWDRKQIEDQRAYEELALTLR